MQTALHSTTKKFNPRMKKLFYFYCEAANFAQDNDVALHEKKNFVQFLISRNAIFCLGKMNNLINKINKKVSFRN